MPGMRIMWGRCTSQYQRRNPSTAAGSSVAFTTRKGRWHMALSEALRVEPPLVGFDEPPQSLLAVVQHRELVQAAPGGEGDGVLLHVRVGSHDHVPPVCEIPLRYLPDAG